MSAKEVIFRRRSTRAFLDKPLAEEDLMDLLETANRTPSWTNSQPWEVFVVTGDKLKQFKEAYQKEVGQFTMDTIPFDRMDIQFPGYDSWSSAPKAVENMVGFKEKLLKDTAMSKDEFWKLSMENNYNFFNAPAIVYIGLAKNLGPYSMFDLGAYQLSLMLAAEDKGIQSCPAGSFALLGNVIRKELDIPENIDIALGIALGYADPDHVLNKRGPMQRMTLDQYVRIMK